MRAHLLGIDDGPFEKGQADRVPIVGVMMEGADLVEGVAITDFPVDGADATRFVVDWVRGLRMGSSLQGIVLGGITIAGLGVIDIRELADELESAALVVTRRDTTDDRVSDALEAAGLADRRRIVERHPPAIQIIPGLFLACAGIDPDTGEAWARGALNKAKLPEPLRLAHLIAAAIASGESRGRV